MCYIAHGKSFRSGLEPHDAIEIKIIGSLNMEIFCIVNHLENTRVQNVLIWLQIRHLGLLDRITSCVTALPIYLFA